LPNNYRQNNFVKPVNMRKRNLKATPKKEKLYLTYEQVEKIAYMYIVEKKSTREIAKFLLVKPRYVTDTVSARSHKSLWIDAIASLARKGLIDG